MDELSQNLKEILDNANWEYDEDLPDVPWEYTIIKWNNENIKELEDFADMLYHTAEPNVILDDEPSECFTCKRIGDYYYAVSEKDEGECICRTFADINKLKDVYYFMQNKHFKYKKGMSLNDIYNQLNNTNLR